MTRMLANNNNNIQTGCGGSILADCFFYCFLLNPGKTIINPIFLSGFTSSTTELREPPGLQSLATVIKNLDIMMCKLLDETSNQIHKFPPFLKGFLTETDAPECCWNVGVIWNSGLCGWELLQGGPTCSGALWKPSQLWVKVMIALICRAYDRRARLTEVLYMKQIYNNEVRNTKYNMICRDDRQNDSRTKWAVSKLYGTSGSVSGGS